MHDPQSAQGRWELKSGHWAQGQDWEQVCEDEALLREAAGSEGHWVFSPGPSAHTDAVSAIQQGWPA